MGQNWRKAEAFVGWEMSVLTKLVPLNPILSVNNLE